MANSKTVNNSDAPLAEWTPPGQGQYDDKRTDDENRSACVGCGVWEKDFREHFLDHYAPNGAEYGRYSDAYQFGHEAGHKGLEEDELRREWEAMRPRSWDEFKDPIQFAWKKVRK